MSRFRTIFVILPLLGACGGPVFTTPEYGAKPLLHEQPPYAVELRVVDRNGKPAVAVRVTKPQRCQRPALETRNAPARACGQTPAKGAEVRIVTHTAPGEPLFIGTTDERGRREWRLDPSWLSADARYRIVVDGTDVGVADALQTVPEAPKAEPPRQTKPRKLKQRQESDFWALPDGDRDEFVLSHRAHQDAHAGSALEALEPKYRRMAKRFPAPETVYLHLRAAANAGTISQADAQARLAAARAEYPENPWLAHAWGYNAALLCTPPIAPIVAALREAADSGFPLAERARQIATTVESFESSLAKAQSLPWDAPDAGEKDIDFDVSGDVLHYVKRLDERRVLSYARLRVAVTPHLVPHATRGTPDGCVVEVTVTDVASGGEERCFAGSSCRAGSVQISPGASWAPYLDLTTAPGHSLSVQFDPRAILGSDRFWVRF